MKGYIQVYTGEGKGKTTAALGLALRAAGAGLRIFIVQFLKAGTYSEIQALRRLSDRISIEQYGSGRFVVGTPSPEEIDAAGRGLARAGEILSAGDHELVILDEANVATALGLFSVSALLDVMARKPPAVELVLTGRGAAAEVIRQADLVTEMRPVKHYYDRGVAARIGIEH